MRVSPEVLFWGWGGFSLVCLVSMVTTPSAGAVAFHLIWVSMALVYGLQNWSTLRTMIVLTLAVALSTFGMASFIVAEGAEWTELAEVPLMAAVFLAMVWHVRRRAAALAQSRASAAREHRANELKELFVRNCSHEMRTPITVARGYAELVHSEMTTVTGEAELAVVIEELDKLTALAGRLLMLADVYDSPRFERDYLDLAEVVRQGVHRWGPTADRRWTVESPNVLVEGDDSRLEAALDCLVENAINVTAAGDQITLRCGIDGSWAYLEVADTGIGFERSTDPLRPRSAGQSGTGLGLPIARAVVEGHGGRLVVGSEHEGGARVRLEIPASPALPDDLV